jgi:hypothetical protein
VLDGKKPIEVLDGFRYVPEDAPKDAKPEATDDVPTEDDEAAADEAAKNEAK